jgi:putative FmdB family regulatory protein
MPIYEFRCNHCAHIYEDLVPREATGETQRCPKCGHVGAKRLISAFAAHGLENGHIGVGRKLTGGGAPANTVARESAPGTSCGPSCGCH